MKRTLWTGILVAWATMMGAASAAQAGSGVVLGDAAFASKLCAAWNTSELPAALSSKSAGGSGWIDVKIFDSAADGYQKVVSGRADCKGWPEFELVIERQADGKAVCTSAGAFTGDKMTWKFVPSTANWFEFGRKFGMGAFYDLWNNGMVGKKTTAWGNRSSFAIFFRLAAAIAIDGDWRTGCTGLDEEETLEAIEDLKGG